MQMILQWLPYQIHVARLTRSALKITTEDGQGLSATLESRLLGNGIYTNSRSPVNLIQEEGRESNSCYQGGIRFVPR